MLPPPLSMSSALPLATTRLLALVVATAAASANTPSLPPAIAEFNRSLLAEFDAARLARERRERPPVHGFGILYGAAASPVQLIIDTDLGFDVDDVGALAVANHLQDIGLCRLLAVVHNTGFVKGIGGVDVINNFYGRGSNGTHLDLGAYTGAWGSSAAAQRAQDRYTSILEQRYPSAVQTYREVAPAVEVYSRVLAAADDHSVVIASIGELTNLRDVLKANATLFNQKVKAVHYMDGSYNFGCGDSKGSGWSPWLGSTQDCDGAAQYVQDHVAHGVMQTYSLNGGNVLCGSRFQAGCGQGPVKDAYQIWTNRGSRPSWDLITVYLAVRGVESLYSSAVAGVDRVDYHGAETFDTSVGTRFKEYQVWIDGSRSGDVTRILDDLICAAPCGGTGGVGECAGYTMHAGRNCYSGRGATDIDGAAACGVMSVRACQERCDATAGCDGVVVTHAAGVSGAVNCYRKASIDVDACDYGHAWGFDTWVKKSVESKKSVEGQPEPRLA